MAKLYFQGDPLEKDAIPSIVNSIDQLNSAASFVASLSIPSGFGYASSLNETGEFIRNTRNKLDNIQEWLKTSITVYTSRLASMDAQLLVLSRSKVGVKIGRIL